MRAILLLIAAVIAVIAGLAALQLSNKPAPVAPVVERPTVSTVDVLVARVPIAVGTTITESMLDTQPWPENLVLKNFIVRGSDEGNIVGKVTRTGLQAREPFVLSNLASPGEAGFLAATLPAGTRAITVATDAVSGVAGFIFPGDRVDVILTHDIPYQLQGAEKPAEVRVNTDRPAFSEVLLANVPVLAVNLRSGVNKEELLSGNLSVSPSSITLQVLASDVGNIRLAEKVGTLSFALRSSSDSQNSNVAQPSDLEDLTHVHLSGAPQVEDDSVKVMKR
jgi:pilus assembly protein CpaB